MVSSMPVIHLRPVTTQLALLVALLLSTASSAVTAVEVRVTVPNPLIPGIAHGGRITIEQPQSEVTDVQALPAADSSVDLRPDLNQRTRSNVNGVTSMGFGLQISIAKPGTFTIPAIEVTFADGSTKRSEPVSVDAWEAQSWLEGQAVVRAQFTPSVIVPGQDSELRWQVATPYGEDLSAKPNAQPRLAPELIANGQPRRIGNGFAVGVNESIWTITEYSLTVTCSRPGTFRADGQIGIGQVRRSVFDDSFRQFYTAPIRPAELTVTALPLEGRPDNFSGLIGAVTITSELERETMILGEGARLSLTVSGEQVDLNQRPSITVPDGLRLRELDQTATATSQSFTWNVEPERSGSFVIPAIRLSYFDPNSQLYRFSESNSLKLEVLPGRQRTATVVGDLGPAHGADGLSGSLQTALGAQLPPMPAPLRGAGAAVPAAQTGLLAVIIGALAGLVLALAPSLLRRSQRQHPRSALRRVADQQDLAIINQTLHQVRACCTDATERSELDALAAEVERARFGQHPLSADTRARLRQWGNA